MLLFNSLILLGVFIKTPVLVVPFTLQFLFTNLAGLLLGKRLGAIDKGRVSGEMIQELKAKLYNGYKLSKNDALMLADADSEDLCTAADDIREHFCGNAFDLCTIINGKSGKCTENCRYCAQSACYGTMIEEYSLLDEENILKEALYNHSKGVLRYSVVTSGKRLKDNELESICRSYNKIRQCCDISLCASHGLLNYSQFLKLKMAGVTRYHNNLETSRRYFPNVCTSHTYQDKIDAIKAAQTAGLEVCSGGIIGLGETLEDRIDMALDIRALGIKSVPVNVLNPIKGTAFEKSSVLQIADVCKTVAIFRFIMPDAAIRLAGGRGFFLDKGRSMFKSGANAAITGDMLTTSGISIDDDIKMLFDLSFKVKML